MNTYAKNISFPADFWNSSKYSSKASWWLRGIEKFITIDNKYIKVLKEDQNLFMNAKGINLPLGVVDIEYSDFNGYIYYTSKKHPSKLYGTKSYIPFEQRFKSITLIDGLTLELDLSEDILQIKSSVNCLYILTKNKESFEQKYSIKIIQISPNTPFEPGYFFETYDIETPRFLLREKIKSFDVHKSISQVEHFYFVFENSPNLFCGVIRRGVIEVKIIKKALLKEYFKMDPVQICIDRNINEKNDFSRILVTRSDGSVIMLKHSEKAIKVTKVYSVTDADKELLKFSMFFPVSLENNIYGGVITNEQFRESHELILGITHSNTLVSLYNAGKNRCLPLVGLSECNSRANEKDKNDLTIYENDVINWMKNMGNKYIIFGDKNKNEYLLLATIACRESGVIEKKYNQQIAYFEKGLHDS